MVVDLLIRNALIVSSKATLSGSIAVNEGKITSIVKDYSSIQPHQIIDAKGKVVLPGVIDGHVHVLEKMTPETWESVSSAAAAGGVTTVIDHPTGDPNIFDAASFKTRLREAEDKSLVDFAFHGAGNVQKEELVEELIGCGITTFKAFTSGEWLGPPFTNSDIMEMSTCLAKRGCFLGLHAEDDSIVTKFTKLMTKEGREPEHFHRSRPAIAETLAVSSALHIAETEKCRMHFFHISAKGSVNLIQAAQRHGVRVTAETHPQFLLLNQNVYKDKTLGRIAKMNPTIKSEEDRRALWNAVRSGVIQLVTTDHCAWSRDEKLLPNIWDVKPGFPGVETLLPLMLKEVRKGRLTINKLVEIMAENPASIFGLTNKGRIREGYDADLVIVDLKGTKIIDDDELFTAGNVTPFNGFQVCPPVTTIRRGEVIFHEGELLTKGGGRYLPRKRKSAGHT